MGLTRRRQAGLALYFLLTLTAAATTNVWKFGIMGDTRGAWTNGTSLPTNQWWVNVPVVQAIASNMLAEGVQCAINSGAIIYELWFGDHPDPQYQYDIWKAAIAPLTNAGIPVYTVRGNHETYQETNGSIYRANFAGGLPTNGPPNEVGLTWSFATNNALIVGLEAYTNGAQNPAVNTTWLTNQLAGNRLPHVFVVSHPPAFQCSITTTLALTQSARDEFWNALGQYGVRLYICGHDHFYNRGIAADAAGREIQQLLMGSGSVYHEGWYQYYEPARIKLGYADTSHHGYSLVTVSDQYVSVECRFMTNGTWYATDTFTYAVGTVPVMVGAREAQAVTSLPRSATSRIGLLRAFFAHASVGDNMMSGITSLHAAAPTSYPLVRVSSGGTPPTATTNGAIYDYQRGNPGWQAKVDGFGEYVSNGWRAGRVNYALNKFCYIDQDADLDYYLAAMQGLETTFPHTVFVYMTIPLMTSPDSDNYLRNVFNDGLRSWVQQHSRVLFDVADIEAHDTNGLEYTYIWNHRACQQLWTNYSSDGGHLNTLGSRQVALGFYALGAALMGADRDGDGASDADELIAGTSPTDPADVFALGSLTAASNGAPVLTWSSVSNHWYSLARMTNLLDWGTVVGLLTNAPATPPWNTYTDAPPIHGPAFYRTSVQQ
jgi:hypothetical protein